MDEKTLKKMLDEIKEERLKRVGMIVKDKEFLKKRIKKQAERH